MKIFNIGLDNKERAYVQVEDFITLTKVGKPIPASIYDKAMKVKYCTNDNRYNFVEFNEPEEIEFFKNFEWIVNYKDIRYLTSDELKALAKRDNDEANDIAELWNTLTPEEKKLNMDAANRYSLLHHRIKSYGQMLWHKQGHIRLNMPIEPDDSGWIIDYLNYKVTIQSSLDPNIFLVFKDDESLLNDDNSIKQEMIEEAMKVAEDNISDTNEFFANDFDLEVRTSDDKKYLIFEYKLKEYVDELDNNKLNKKGSK